MRDLAGKVAFITGGVSGVGLGIAKVLAAAGTKVVITYRREDHRAEAMAYFRTLANASVHAIQLDVTDRQAMARAADEVERVFGNIHILCNNAGIGILGSMLEATYDDWDWATRVNLGGVINGVQTFVPRMRAHREGGHIVNVASMGGLFASAGAGIYTTTKFAVVGLTEALRSELEPHGIGVSVCCPGLVRTNIHEVEQRRPAEFASSNYKRGAEVRARFLKERVLSAGMDPLEVGERIVKGIGDNDLYILTHSEYEQGARERFEAILASFDPMPGTVAQDRLAAEASVLRYPVYARERDRRLRARRSQGG